MSAMLKTYLDKRALTQSDFAEVVGTTPATISRIIKGKFRPGLELAVKIAEATDGAVPVSSWTREAA